MNAFLTKYEDAGPELFLLCATGCRKKKFDWGPAIPGIWGLEFGRKVAHSNRACQQWWRAWDIAKRLIKLDGPRFMSAWSRIRWAEVAWKQYQHSKVSSMCFCAWVLVIREHNQNVQADPVKPNDLLPFARNLLLPRLMIASVRHIVGWKIRCYVKYSLLRGKWS
jgi:hypothetical protein